MEEHPKHDKKKNSKTMATGVGVAINIGGASGSVGMGGILLFGGALLTATIVLALKARRSSKKSRSASPETQTDQSEFTVKTNKDVSVDSHNQSVVVSSIKGVPSTRSIQDLSREEKQKTDVEVESGIGIMFSVAGEDEERYNDSVFESNKIEIGSPIVDAGEKDNKYCNETNQHSNTGTQQSSAPTEATEVEFESMHVAVGEEHKKYDNENNQQSNTGTQQSSTPTEATEVEFESMQVAVGEEHKKYDNENNQQSNTGTQQSSTPIEATEVEFESMRVAVGEEHKKYCNENNQQSNTGTQQSLAPIEATEVEFESMRVAVGEEHKKYNNENNQQSNTGTQQSSTPIEATEVQFESMQVAVGEEHKKHYNENNQQSNTGTQQSSAPIEATEVEFESMWVAVGEEHKKYCNENNQQSKSNTDTQQSSAPIEATKVEFESMQVAVGEEHKKYYDENNQQSNTDTQQSSAPIEAADVEFESMQMVVGDDEVSDEEEIPTTGHGVEETAAALEAACVNQEVKLKLVQFNQDCEDEMSVADCQEELTSNDETGYAGDGIVSEAIDTVCVGVEKAEKGECDGEGEGGDLTDEIAIREENQQTRNKLVVVTGFRGDDETATEEDQESRTFSNDEPATVSEDNPSPPYEVEIQHVQNKKTPEAETMITEGEPGENKENDELLIPTHALTDVTSAKAQVGSNGNGVGNSPDVSMQQVEEADENSHEIQESMEGDETILLGNGHRGSKPYKERFCKGTQGAFLKYCYSELLHFSEISLFATLLLILISLAIGTALQRYLLK